MAAWIPFLDLPLSPDEAGFLMLATHWHSGTSLYGDYWVDRPPLLLWLFSLAGHLGPVGHGAAGLTAPGVKVLGALASGLSVVLAAVIARQVAPTGSWSRTAAVVVAVALLADPLLGIPETNGELLALPFVLAGTACLVTASRRPWWRSTSLLTAAAGALAVCAALVKQNVLDVAVLAVVLFLASRGRLSHLGGRVAAFVSGGAGAFGAALAVAAARGTSPTGLWDAAVAFRFQASAVIRSSASSATTERFAHLVMAALISGVTALLLVTSVLAIRMLFGRPRARNGTTGLHAPLLWAALAMTAWELVGVAGGGSYWLHYLTGLVPGLVLLVALVRPSPRWRTALTVAVSWAVLAGAAAWAEHADAPTTVSEDARVVAYLRTHARPGDGVVVAFGHPDIVAGSGLTSPYEYPWSLPARVRDPRLTELSDVLGGRHAPRWVVVAGQSIDTWGVDATTAQQILEENYVEQGAYGDWHVWKRDGGGR